MVVVLVVLVVVMVVLVVVVVLWSYVIFIECITAALCLVEATMPPFKHTQRLCYPKDISFKT